MRLNASFCVAILCATSVSAETRAISDPAKSENSATRVEVLCAQEVGEQLAPCKASIEHKDGSTLVIIRFPNGFSRLLFFKDAAFQRGNTTMSGTGTDTDWSLSDGIYRIRVDDQQYEVPEALISGQ